MIFTVKSISHGRPNAPKSPFVIFFFQLDGPEPSQEKRWKKRDEGAGDGFNAEFSSRRTNNPLSSSTSWWVVRTTPARAVVLSSGSDVPLESVATASLKDFPL